MQALTQFFDVVLDIFLYGGSLRKTIAYMNVHEHLGQANEVAQPSAFKPIVHPRAKAHDPEL
jgi:hypothetical protein